jgi:cell division septation protein DedD
MKLFLMGLSFLFLLSCTSKSNLEIPKDKEEKKESLDDKFNKDESSHTKRITTTKENSNEKKIENKTTTEIIKVVEEAQADDIIINKSSNLADPFLNDLLKNPTQAIKLNYSGKKVLATRWEKRWRVQVVSTTYAEKAQEIQDTLKNRYNIPIFRKKTSTNIYKTLVGDYLNRTDADILKEDLVRFSFKQAWTVLDSIEVAVQDSSLAKKELITDLTTETFFRLQIATFTSELLALEYVKKNKAQFEKELIIRNVGQLFKVLIGQEKDRNNLINLKKELELKGFKTFTVEL